MPSAPDPKQGERRWLWWETGPFADLQGLPRPQHGEELMSVSEHQAVLRAVEGERDKARADVATLRHTTVARLCQERDQANTRAEAAEKQLVEARDGLVRYGRHVGACTLRRDGSCTCGWSDFLRTTSSGTEGEDCGGCGDAGVYEEGGEWMPCGECQLGQELADRLRDHAAEKPAQSRCYGRGRRGWWTVDACKPVWVNCPGCPGCRPPTQQSTDSPEPSTQGGSDDDVASGGAAGGSRVSETSDRSVCVFCQREKATDADWETNGRLPSDREDEEAQRLGLDRLCWEPEDDSCLALLAESGRPTNLAAALEALAAATPTQQVVPSEALGDWPEATFVIGDEHGGFVVSLAEPPHLLDGLTLRRYIPAETLSSPEKRSPAEGSQEEGQW